MDRLILQLLDFTRIRTGEGLPLDCAPMDVGALARLVVGELAAAHPERTIQLETRGDLWGSWDRDRLGQLLCNLGSNACLHAGEGPVAPDSRASESTG